MATAKILHVGDDLCQRIPVLSRAGYTVLRSENSIQAISDAFADGDFFSAILFHSDLAAPAEPAIQTTRSLSTAPLVLFQNPTVLCDDHDFDLVIPALTPPDIWLQNLRELVERAHELCEQARQLRKDCESVRSHSQALRASAARNRAIAIDSNVLLPRDGGKTSGSE